MENEELIELKNLLNSINEDSEDIDIFLKDEQNLYEYIQYLQRLRMDSIASMKTSKGDNFKKNRYRHETLVKILNIIYFNFVLV